METMPKYQPMQISYFECQCSSPEHVLRFNYDPDENELWTEIQLIQYKNVFKRIWTAIRYIFKFQAKWGHWDCWLLKNEDCEKLKELLDKVIVNDKAKSKMILTTQKR